MATKASHVGNLSTCWKDLKFVNRNGTKIVSILIPKTWAKTSLLNPPKMYQNSSSSLEGGCTIKCFWWGYITLLNSIDYSMDLLGHYVLLFDLIRSYLKVYNFVKCKILQQNFTLRSVITFNDKY